MLPPMDKSEAHFNCEVDQSIRVIELDRSNGKAFDAAKVAEAAEVACEQYFEPAYQEMLAMKGNDPELSRRNEEAQRQTDLEMHRTPEESAALGRMMARVGRRTALIEMLQDPQFSELLKRRQVKMKNNAPNN
jgi:hypothetical protein